MAILDPNSFYQPSEWNKNSVPDWFYNTKPISVADAIQQWQSIDNNDQSIEANRLKLEQAQKQVEAQEKIAEIAKGGLEAQDIIPRAQRIYLELGDVEKAQSLQPKDQRKDPIKMDNRLIDPNTYEVIKEFPKEPKTPKQKQYKIWENPATGELVIYDPTDPVQMSMALGISPQQVAEQAAPAPNRSSSPTEAVQNVLSKVAGGRRVVVGRRQ